MAATAAAQLNSRRGEIYFIKFSRSLSAYAFSPLTRFIGGLLESFSGVKDESGNVSKFTRRYKDIKELTGISEPSIYRALHEFKDKELARKEGASTYVFEQDKVSGRKWYCPLEVLWREFEMTDDDGNKFKKKLTPNTVLVYAYIYSKKGEVYSTNKEIADELGIHVDTVAAALKYLRWAKLIILPKAKVAVNRWKKSRIKLNLRWAWFKQEKKYRGRTSATETPAEDEETTRELYYSRLQSRAQKKAQTAENKALKNVDYNAIMAEISEVRNLSFRACTPQQAQAQELKISALYLERENVLKSIGLSSEQLDPRHYVKCTCCGDTGTTPEGAPCDCYERHKRGSPPVKSDKRTTKGPE